MAKQPDRSMYLTAIAHDIVKILVEGGVTVREAIMENNGVLAVAKNIYISAPPDIAFPPKKEKK